MNLKKRDDVSIVSHERSSHKSNEECKEMSNSNTQSNSDEVSAYKKCQRLLRRSGGDASHVSVPTPVLGQILQDYEVVKKQSIRRKQRIQELKDELEVLQHQVKEVEGHYQLEQQKNADTQQQHVALQQELTAAREELTDVKEEVFNLRSALYESMEDVERLRHAQEEAYHSASTLYDEYPEEPATTEELARIQQELNEAVQMLDDANEQLRVNRETTEREIKELEHEMQAIVQSTDDVIQAYNAQQEELQRLRRWKAIVKLCETEKYEKAQEVMEPPRRSKRLRTSSKRYAYNEE